MSTWWVDLFINQHETYWISLHLAWACLRWGHRDINILHYIISHWSRILAIGQVLHKDTSERYKVNRLTKLMYNFKPFTSNTNLFIKFLNLIHLTCKFINLNQHSFKKFGYTFDPLGNEITGNKSFGISSIYEASYRNSSNNDSMVF